MKAPAVLASTVQRTIKFLLKGRGAILVREEAEIATKQARDAVVLLEQARTLLAKDNARQLAIQHIDEAITQAARRAAMLEDWYRRSYFDSSGFQLSRAGI